MFTLQDVMDKLISDLNLHAEYDETCRIWRLDNSAIVIVLSDQDSNWYKFSSLNSDRIIVANTRKTFNKWSQAYLVDSIPTNLHGYAKLLDALLYIQSNEHMKLSDMFYDRNTVLDIFAISTEIDSVKKNLSYFKDLVAIVSNELTEEHC